MNRIDWLIATGGNPCFGLEALVPILTSVLPESLAAAAPAISGAAVGAGELGAGGALLGGITGGGQGALRGLEAGGLTGAGLGAGGGIAEAAGLGAAGIGAGETLGGALGGAVGGAATGQSPLTGGLIGGAAGLGAGLTGGGGFAPAAAATAPTTAPMPGNAAVTIPNTGIQSYSDQLGVQGGLQGPQTGANVNMLAGTLDGGGSGATGGTQPLGGGGGGGGQPGDPGMSTAATPYTGDLPGYGPITGNVDPSAWAPTTAQRMTASTEAGQLYAATPEGAGAAVPGGSTGGWGSGIMDFLGNPSPLQLAGAGIGGVGLLTSAMQGNKYAGLENQLQQQATGASTMTTALQSPLFTGILPPGAQQNLNQQKQDAAAAIRSGYARAGMAGSTSEAQAIAAENARIDNSKLQIEQQMFNDAAGYAKLAPADLQQLYTIQNQQDQNFQRALASFTAALAGGRGGTSQPTAA